MNRSKKKNYNFFYPFDIKTDVTNGKRYDLRLWLMCPFCYKKSHLFRRFVISLWIFDCHFTIKRKGTHHFLWFCYPNAIFTCEKNVERLVGVEGQKSKYFLVFDIVCLVVQLELYFRQVPDHGKLSIWRKLYKGICWDLVVVVVL